VQCPRCSTENGAAAVRCAGCGVPIALADDVDVTALGRPLPLDRRGDRRESSSAAWESLVPVPMDWEMAPPAEGSSAPRREPPRYPSRPRPAVRPPAPARPTSPVPPADFDVDPVVEAVEVHRQRAPAWKRVAAWVADGAALGALLAFLLLPVLGRGDLASPRRDVAVLASMAIALVAFAYQWLGVTLMGATPGMRILGLQVVGPDGGRPPPGRSAARALLALVSTALLGMGLLLALFTRSGRGAHDFAAGTWVVQVAGGGRAA
jgi:uncharacterized RDD family membrane protein YckC